MMATILENTLYIVVLCLPVTAGLRTSISMDGDPSWGSGITLECHATDLDQNQNVQEFTYKWFLEDTLISPIVDRILIEGNGKILENIYILNVDVGSYTCAVDGVEQQTNIPFDFRLEKPPGKPVLEIDSAEIPIRTQYSLTCHLTDIGHPKATKYRFCSTTSGGCNEMITETSNPTHGFSAPQNISNMDIVCQAENDVSWSPVSEPIHLEFKAPIEVINPKEDKTHQLSINEIPEALYCTVIGSDIQIVNWYRNNDLINPNSDELVKITPLQKNPGSFKGGLNHSYLTVLEFLVDNGKDNITVCSEQRKIEGDYVCKAEQDIGSKSYSDESKKYKVKEDAVCALLLLDIPDDKGGSDGFGILIGAIGGGCVFLILVALIALIVLKKRKKSKKKDLNKTDAEKGLLDDTKDTSVLKKDNPEEGAKEDEVYIDPNTLNVYAVIPAAKVGTNPNDYTKGPELPPGHPTLSTSSGPLDVTFGEDDVFESDAIPTPCNLKIKNLQSKSCTLSWDIDHAIPENLSFKMVMKRVEKDGSKKFYSEEVTSRYETQIKDLKQGTFVFNVQARSGNGDSNFVESEEFAPPPQSPTDLVIKNRKRDSCVLVWKPPEDVSTVKKYKKEKSTDCHSGAQEHYRMEYTKGKETEKKLESLTSKSHYFFVSSCGESGESEPVSTEPSTHVYAQAPPKPIRRSTSDNPSEEPPSANSHDDPKGKSNLEDKPPVNGLPHGANDTDDNVLDNSDMPLIANDIYEENTKKELTFENWPEYFGIHQEKKIIGVCGKEKIVQTLVRGLAADDSIVLEKAYIMKRTMKTHSVFQNVEFCIIPSVDMSYNVEKARNIVSKCDKVIVIHDVLLSVSEKAFVEECRKNMLKTIAVIVPTRMSEKFETPGYSSVLELDLKGANKVLDISEAEELLKLICS